MESSEEDRRVAAILEAKRSAAARHLPELRATLLQWRVEGRKGYAETDWVLHCNDATLLRFLENSTVHKGETVKSVRVVDAAKALGATIHWRHEHGFDSSPHVRETHCCDGCEADAFGHCLFSIGVDRRGWEVVYSCPGRSRIKEPSSLVRHLFLWLESIFEGPFESRPGSSTSMVLLVDLHGFGLSDMDPRVALRCVPAVLNHYPDRVAQVALLDSPWIFKSIWSLITPLLDDTMKMKVRMLRGDAMSSYFSTFFHDNQTTFLSKILQLRATFTADSYPTITPTIRRSLGPADAYTRQYRGAAQKQLAGGGQGSGPCACASRAADNEEAPSQLVAMTSQPIKVPDQVPSERPVGPDSLFKLVARRSSHDTTSTRPGDVRVMRVQAELVP